MLAYTQVERLWRAAMSADDTFLFQLCEEWMDASTDAARDAREKTIRAYIKDSSFESWL